MKRSRYDLLRLWLWLLDQRQGVTAREIADRLGCSQVYARNRVLPSLELRGYYLVDVGATCGKRGRPATIYAAFRPDENWREK